MAKSLGRFEITEFIAKGGMGRVYRGHHVVARTKSAIKLVKGGARRSALLREVRAAASLQHSGIIDVFDYGQVTETEALASDGEFEAGSLWLAMEFADCGSLEDIAPPANFAALRRIILDILDALAHAHARGLVHRDLKPGNILLSRRRDGLALLLADFGIAHVRSNEANLPETTDSITAPAAGTPLYMAPEQIHGHWRDQGPWTDIYALGCLAWELATGIAPFKADSSLAVAMAHLHDDAGDFEPRIEVPDHFEGWLRRCLEKEGADRFQFAADAADALGIVDDALDVELSPRVSSGEGSHTLTRTQLLTLLQVDTRDMPSVELNAVRRRDVEPLEPTRVPASWRPLREPLPLGQRTELGLFGLREIPLVGLDDQRDELWAVFRRATIDQSPTFAVCTGKEGHGKTRMLQWLGRRAMELGVANTLHVSTLRGSGPLESLTSALEHYLGCGGLSHPKVVHRLEQRMTGDDRPLAYELASLFRPSPGAKTHVRFDSSVERYDAICRAFAFEARNRPFVVLLDNAQWDVDSLALCEHLTLRFNHAPICVALSMTEEAMHLDARLTRRMKSFVDATRVREIKLGNLARADLVDIARKQFGLASDVVEKLVDASGGDLAYAMCVFADWIDRGVLRAKTRGWSFGHERIHFPRNLEEAWGARLDRFCARFAVPAIVHEQLAVAAALGVEFSVTEWVGACEAGDFGDPTDLVEPFADAALGSPTRDGLKFASSACVSLLMRRSLERGRLVSLHAACAEATSNRAKRARHLLAAGRTAQGLGVLAPAISEALEHNEYETVIRLAETYVASAGAGTLGTLRVRAMRADALRYIGAVEEAENEASSLIEAATPLAKAEGLRILAGLEHGRGLHVQGIERYTQALELYRSLENPVGVSKCLHGRGWLLLSNGDFPSAADDFQRATQLASQVRSEVDAAWSRHGLAEALVYLKDPRATGEARDCVVTFELVGSRSGRGMALTTLGNGYRMTGDFVSARDAYDAAVTQLRSIKSHLVAFAYVHWGVCELQAGEPGVLEQILVEAASTAMPPAFRSVTTLLQLALDGDVEGAIRAIRENGAKYHPLVPMTLAGLQAQIAPSDLDRIVEQFGL